MRKLRLYIAASLDGKIARPNGSFDWLPDVTAEDYGYESFYSTIDAVVMGYKTYEVCRDMGEWYYKDKRSYVFSRHPGREVVPEAELITEDPVEFTRKLKQTEGKDIWLLGGGEIVSVLHDAGLIDEYIIAQIPILLGEGILLFPDLHRQVNLRLTQTRVYPSGTVMLYLKPQQPV